MRLSSLSLAASALLIAGGVAFFVAARPRATSAEPEPRHPITEELRRAAAKVDNTSAPTFKLTDTEGASQDLAKVTANGPAVLVFIKDDCPCSIEAQPLFQRMYDAFGQKVPFIGITDGDLAHGKEWKAHFQQTFPMIADPKADLMKRFGAKHSAYTALIARGGRIVRLWPGYNQQMLGEITSAIAKEAGVGSPTLSVVDAPTKPTTGCAFTYLP